MDIVKDNNYPAGIRKGTTSMTDLILSEIAIFAERQSISADVAYALPTVFDKVAEIAGQPVRAIIAQATYSNQPLADYIKEVAEKVA